jgi:nucleoside-diphosphate-sugar epimerase
MSETGGIAVLGGSSPLVPFLLEHLRQGGPVTLVSRRPATAAATAATTTYIDAPTDLDASRAISLMPVWELPAYYGWLAARGCRRLVVLSSTSRFTKTGSARPHDRELATRLAGGEEAAEAWAAEHGVALTILRPTMVYGGPADGNVSELARVLRRFRVVPVVGSGSGLRPPAHRGDVAATAARALLEDRTPQTAYDISGGEVLAYRALVDRIRGTVPGPTVVVRVPGWPFRLLERALPRSRKVQLAAGMVDRMGTDMVFDHAAAAADLGHAPRGFTPGAEG